MEKYLVNAQQWLTEAFDEQTRKEVKAMFDDCSSNGRKALEDAFYRNLEFGTGGLRGIMGAGTNRMNRYTVGMATQGICNYLHINAERGDFKRSSNTALRVAISCDSRNNSREFAKVTAAIFAANGIKVLLFEDMRPTPELSYAIRWGKCNAGVMVTASHNPKEYNGYKMYWEDGAQIIAPHDGNIIAKVVEIEDPSQVKWGDYGKAVESGDIRLVGAEIDKDYLRDLKTLHVSPQAVAEHKDIRFVYTPLHGTGITQVPAALRDMGFENVYLVEEQCVADGNFPTVKSPNPEEHSALEMAVALADKVNADVVLATDPDADRVGVAVRNEKNEMVLLNGNQTASILTYYMLSRWKELGRDLKNGYIIKTIVTTELLTAIARKFGVQCYDVLTGFKYIAAIVEQNNVEAENGAVKRTFICGGEESYGFNAGEFVRDKDSVITCSLVAECAAWCAQNGMTLFGFLQKIYSEFGLYMESLLSVTKPGKSGVEEIAGIMLELRNNPPAQIAGKPVVKVIDYYNTEATGLPKSNVLRFFAADGSVVTVRPSGTEPKIKFYFGATGSNATECIAAMREQFSKF